MPTKAELRQQYREFIQSGKYKRTNLNYVVAVSSGLNVTQEIPDEAYKRASWASNQGASFIEVSLGGPSQIYNEWDNLLSISRQLGLSFDCHFPVQVPFDYAMPYREQRQELGYFYSHEFMHKFIKAWGEFKEALESQKDANGRQQRVYGINSHLVKSTIPTREERMAGSVSVDPFGQEIMESRLFQNKTFRIGFFEHYLWESELKDNMNTLQSIANEIEGFRDFQERAREVFTDYMASNGYLTDSILSAVSNIGDPDQVKKTLDWKYAHDSPFSLSPQVKRAPTVGAALAKAAKTVGDLTDINPREPDEEDQKKLQRLNEEFQKSLQTFQDATGRVIYENLPEEVTENLRTASNFLGENASPFTKEMLARRIAEQPINVDAAMRNIAGTDADVPETVDKVRQHREGISIAQSIPRFDPEMYANARWSNLIPVEILERKESNTLIDTEKFQEARDEMDEQLKGEIKDGIMTRLELEDPYKGTRDYMRNTERQMSKGEVAFRDIINFRGGYFRDQMSRESVIFWYLLPWWMPFSGIPQVEQMWTDITELDADDYSFSNWKQFKQDLEELKNSKHYDWIIAAGAGAYVWGHFTQVKDRGQEKTFVEMLDEYGLTMDWESHNVGNQGNGKIWKPYDIIKVCNAINNTPVGEGEEQRTCPVMHCTIDMEHLAMNGVNPLWLIEGKEDEDGNLEYRGLDENDGRFITKQHVTHPALSETGHHHQPIRRGDTLVYRHLEALVKKGFCQREDRPCVVMYELGAEKAESTYMLRLMLNMLELGITADEIEGKNVDAIWKRFEEDGEDLEFKDYVIMKFFGLTDEEWQHEWQEIFEHALDPLEGLLEGPKPSHTWTGRGATESGTRPEEWQKEEYR